MNEMVVENTQIRREVNTCNLSSNVPCTKQKKPMDRTTEVGWWSDIY